VVAAEREVPERMADDLLAALLGGLSLTGHGQKVSDC
jgi:hypothetical protein